MLREFEILARPGSPSVSVKRGFCWPGFFLLWIWAFSRGLWVQGALLFVATLAIGLARLTTFAGDPIFSVLLGLIVAVAAGMRGNSWRVRRLERKGYGFVTLVAARSAAAAVAAHALGAAKAPAARRKMIAFVSLPGGLQRLVAIAWLTWKAAFRFRLFLVIATLLLASVVGLPLLIKDDGTARGFTQILLTYTLSVITVLLGLSTLWLSCGTLARDIEECQMQLIAVKPVARWQIWLGKWLGIVSLNAALLALSGASVYGLLQWRATKLPPAEQKTLRNEVLVARGSVKEGDHYNEIIKTETEQRLRERLKESHDITSADLPEVRKQIMEQVKAQFQVVPPGMARIWKINLGLKRYSLHGQPLQLRVKFNSADKSPSGTFAAIFQVGVPKQTKLWDETMSLSPDTFHEFEIPPDLYDNNGVLTIACINPNDVSLLFPLDEGMEVLYREGGFGLNFARGVAIIFCWMALLAALGLTSASFLSFPVAAFFSLGLLTMALSTGTLSSVVSEGTVLGSNHPSAFQSALNAAVVPVFRAALDVINLAKDFSPIDSLSSGRSISWGELGKAFGQIVLLLGGIIGAAGMYIFSRRELATAQGNQ